MRSCLLVISNPLVAADIRETIGILQPPLRPLAYSCTEDALDDWPRITAERILFAILSSPLRELDALGLSARLAALAVPVILVSTRVERIDRPGWLLLPIPFDEEALLAALSPFSEDSGLR